MILNTIIIDLVQVQFFGHVYELDVQDPSKKFRPTPLPESHLAPNLYNSMLKLNRQS